MKLNKLVRNSINKLAQIRSFIACRSFISSASGVEKEKADCVVIGAGVVGIAVARELCLNYGRNVLVIESGSTFGTGSSSRNSEVIHGGIYYPTNSLKACFCVRGRRLLYDYCKEHGIPHKQIGKLIVATRYEEVPKLNHLLNRGKENGVEGLRMMEASEAMAMEPQLQCLKALWSPTSGIIDSHSLMLSQLGEAESHGTTFCYNSTVVGAHLEGNQIYLHISETESVKNWDNKSQQCPDFLLLPKLVVNSAGLSSAALARCFSGINPGVIPPSYYARGCYFSLLNSRVPPFNHLIYPIPEDGGLGVHVTLDLDGQVKFGPDVEWLHHIDVISSIQNKFDYTVCADRANRFYPEIRKYYPALKDDSLQPSYAGIRPKISGPGEGFADFIIQVLFDIRLWHMTSRLPNKLYSGFIIDMNSFTSLNSIVHNYFLKLFEGLVGESVNKINIWLQKSERTFDFWKYIIVHNFPDL